MRNEIQDHGQISTNRQTDEQNNYGIDAHCLEEYYNSLKFETFILNRSRENHVFPQKRVIRTDAHFDI